MVINKFEFNKKIHRPPVYQNHHPEQRPFQKPELYLLSGHQPFETDLRQQ